VTGVLEAEKLAKVNLKLEIQGSRDFLAVFPTSKV
jgi:hypothetical protein